jgi:predicted kinase
MQLNLWSSLMSKLIIIRGLPGCGKSTEAYYRLGYLTALGEKAMIVCRDDLRFMNGYGKYAGAFESVITTQQHALIREGLKKGFTVISPDTNLNSKFLKELAKIAEHFGAGVEVVDLDVPLEECLRRDALRTGREHVGEDVIRDFHKRYFSKGFPANPLTNVPPEVTVEPYEPNTQLEHAVIVDLDGTTADKHAGRSYYDYTTVDQDLPHTDVIDLVKILAEHAKIVYMSGRPESCRELTEQWIKTHIGVEGPLFMRSTGDQRADYIIKLELFNKHLRHEYNVIGALDDRTQVIQLWRKLGVRAYQVKDGDY